MRVIVPEIESAMRSAGIITTEPVLSGLVFVDDGKRGCAGVQVEISQAETGKEVGE